ncbi:MAG: hypothetical protein ACTSWW_02965 [Promethearchaeota archaeon]
MEKKPTTEALEIEDDILLNEDLDDDLLLQEAEAFFGPAKKTTVKKPIKPKEVALSIEEPQTNIKKPVILKTTMRELQQFMVAKAKMYEEMAYHTILRKLPPKWHFTEPVLIDILEALIENDVFDKEKLTLKMTASSVKFYNMSKI